MRTRPRTSAETPSSIEVTTNVSRETRYTECARTSGFPVGAVREPPVHRRRRSPNAPAAHPPGQPGQVHVFIRPEGMVARAGCLAAAVPLRSMRPQLSRRRRASHPRRQPRHVDGLVHVLNVGGRSRTRGPPTPAWKTSLRVCWTDVGCQRALAMAHGGLWDTSSAPYDSNAALAATHAADFDAVKIDVRITSDDVPVVAHSSPLNWYESLDCTGLVIENSTAAQVTACHRFPSSSETFQRLDEDALAALVARGSRRTSMRHCLDVLSFASRRAIWVQSTSFRNVSRGLMSPFPREVGRRGRRRTGSVRWRARRPSGRPRVQSKSGSMASERSARSTAPSSMSARTSRLVSRFAFNTSFLAMVSPDLLHRHKPSRRATQVVSAVEVRARSRSRPSRPPRSPAPLHPPKRPIRQTSPRACRSARFEQLDPIGSPARKASAWGGAIGARTPCRRENGLGGRPCVDTEWAASRSSGNSSGRRSSRRPCPMYRLM